MVTGAMTVYLDAFGYCSIEAGEPKIRRPSLNMAEENAQAMEWVKTKSHWNPRGFGFIRPDESGPEIFVHCSNLAEELESLEPGQRVQYAERTSTRNGKPEAIAVEVI